MPKYTLPLECDWGRTHPCLGPTVLLFRCPPCWLFSLLFPLLLHQYYLLFALFALFLSCPAWCCELSSLVSVTYKSGVFQLLLPPPPLSPGSRPLFLSLCFASLHGARPRVPGPHEYLFRLFFFLTDTFIKLRTLIKKALSPSNFSQSTAGIIVLPYRLRARLVCRLPSDIEPALIRPPPA